MRHEQYQQGMFDSETHVLQLADADIEYRPNFYSAEESDRLFGSLLGSTDWRQDTITVYGKAHLTPRLTSWIGESWMDYSYSNHTMKAQAWSPLLNGRQSSLIQSRFSSLLCSCSLFIRLYVMAVSP